MNYKTYQFKNLAPICLFTYRKLPELINSIEALQNNYLAEYTDLIIYSDGPKSGVNEFNDVKLVREYINTIIGFKSIKIISSCENIGLSKSIINGITEQLNHYEKIIVLEDDIVTSKNFLNFINSALEYYEDDLNINSISGFSYNLKSMDSDLYSNGFSSRMYPWGWATWKNRWEKIDFSDELLKECMLDDMLLKKISNGGSDLINMIKNSLNNKIDSWMIKMLVYQIKHNKVDVFPKISKSINIGFNNNATNQKTSNKRYSTKLDSSDNIFFDFNPIVKLDPLILADFKNKHSVFRRFFYRLYNLIS